MSTARRAMLFAAAWMVLSGVTAYAVIDGIQPKRLKISNPSNPLGRKVIMLGRETASDDTGPAGVDQRPDQNGATVAITVTDTVSSNQFIVLPTGANWSRIGLIGWKYSDPSGSNGPIRTLILKKSGVGTFLAKLIAQNPGLDILPPQDTSPVLAVIEITIIGGADYCIVFDSSSTVPHDDAQLFLARGGTQQPCPPPTTSTTSSTSTSTSSSTTTSTAIACCGPERIQLVSGVGSLTFGPFPPFPFPAGIQTTIDTSVSDNGVPNCHHGAIVPPGGFTVPHFDLRDVNYCGEIIALGCASGGNAGKGNLWDGHGTTPAITNISKQGDTNDGVCDNTFTGTNCNTLGAGANTLGKVVTMRSASSPNGIRSALDIPVDVIVWSDSQCSPALNNGCCLTANYGDDTAANSELLITENHMIISPTTDNATGAFVDLNSDGCKRAGAGFRSPGNDGPKTSSGIPAPGPCCTGGQSTTMAWVGTSFGGGAPLYDIGFQSTTPSTVSGCGSSAGGSCVVTTDPCLGSPGGAFLDPLG